MCFTKFAIYLNNLIFPKTRGLYNFIIHKQPVGYDSSDLAKYKEVLQESCAHKKTIVTRHQLNHIQEVQNIIK